MPVNEVVRSPSAETTSPYRQAMICARGVVTESPISIGVIDVLDKTNKYNFTQGGTGSFMTQGATDMLYTSLAELGVIAVDTSIPFRAAIDWYVGKGVRMNIELPSYVLHGSLDALDLLPGTVEYFGIAGFSKEKTAYEAIGRLDLRMNKFLAQDGGSGRLVGGRAFEKRFYAVEDRAGFARFIGGGSGLTSVGFEISEGDRTPIQYTTGWLIDYAATTLVLSEIIRLNAGTNQPLADRAISCQTLLDELDDV